MTFQQINNARNALANQISIHLIIADMIRDQITIPAEYFSERMSKKELEDAQILLKKLDAQLASMA